MSGVKMGRRVEYSFMAVAVKIVWTQNAKNTLGSFAIYKQSAKNAFFRIDIMRQISLAQLNHLCARKAFACRRGYYRRAVKPGDLRALFQSTNTTKGDSVLRPAIIGGVFLSFNILLRNISVIFSLELFVLAGIDWLV